MQKPSAKFKIVIVPLMFDVKDMLLYQMLMWGTCIDPGTFETFPTLLLETAKDPVPNMLLLREEFATMQEQGVVQTFGNPKQVYERSFGELVHVMESIELMFKGHEEQLDFYRLAKPINRGLQLINTESIYDGDYWY